MDGVDEGNTVGVMYLDFQKAFDMMSHIVCTASKLKHLIKGTLIA